MKLEYKPPHCAWPECQKPVKLGRYRWNLFCREHWGMLPENIRALLIEAESNHSLDSRAVMLALDYSVHKDISPELYLIEFDGFDEIPYSDN